MLGALTHRANKKWIGKEKDTQGNKRTKNIQCKYKEKNKEHRVNARNGHTMQRTKNIMCRYKENDKKGK